MNVENIMEDKAFPCADKQTSSLVSHRSQTDKQRTNKMRLILAITKNNIVNRKTLVRFRLSQRRSEHGSTSLTLIEIPPCCFILDFGGV